MSKIFGDFGSVADLNECACNLLENNEVDDLAVLAQENSIDDKTLRKFINREIQELITGEEPPIKQEEAAAESAEDEPADAKPEETPPPPNETPAQRLQREIKDAKNKNVPTVPIATRLTALCEADAALGVQILLPHKSLKKCFDYVEEQARKKIGGGRGWIDDEEVYQMAVAYYTLDDAEAERKKEEERKKREEDNKKYAEESKKRAAERAEVAKNNQATDTQPLAQKSNPNAKNAPSTDQISLWG